MPNMVFCRGCAAEIHESAPTCPKCGAIQFPARGPSRPDPNGKNKLTAGIFAMLLGFLGVHRFYLGQPLFGALYLLTCGAIVLGLVDGIRYLAMDDSAWSEYVHSGRW